MQNGIGAAIIGFVSRNRILSIAIVVLVASISLIVGSNSTLATMSACYTFGQFPPAGGEFGPGSIYSIQCNYEKDIGQDLIFWARLYEGADMTAVPVHIEIRDPNNDIIISEDHNSPTVVVYVKPEVHGVYNATMSNTVAMDISRPAGKSITIYYGFGHLTSIFPGVSNPAGDAFNAMNIAGYVLVSLSVLTMILVGLRAAYKAARGAVKKV